MNLAIIRWLALLISCIPCTILANDTAGTTSAGGITFVKSPEIRMEREELIISPTKIQVKYHFRNITSQAVTREIYFPLPPYKMLGANATWDEEIDPQLKTRPGVPFMNFTVKVNGEKKNYQTLSRAMLNNRDITQQLQKSRLPLNPELVAGNIPLDEAAQQAHWLAQAKMMGLVDKKQQPRWQKQIFYTWQQTFPANAVTIIEHEYKPAAGMLYSAAVPDQTAAQRISNDLDYIKAIFNIDVNAYQQSKLVKQWLQQRLDYIMAPQCKDCREDKIYAWFFNVDYILKTGANWSGPIKDFTLKIKYPLNSVISYNCFYGTQPVIEQETKHMKQFHIKDFTPQEDLSILFGLSAWPQEK